MEEIKKTKFRSLADCLIALKDEKEYGITFINDINNEVTLTYHDLYTKALTVLHNLQSRGVKPKDELILQIEDNRKFLISFWACMLGGIIPVPLPYSKTEEDKNRFFSIWNKLHNPYVVTEESNIDFLFRGLQNYDIRIAKEKIDERALFFDTVLENNGIGEVQKTELDDIAFIQFSSGSTGNPRGVMLSHSNLIEQVLAIGGALPLTKQCRCLTWMPLTHDMGLISHHLFPVSVGFQHYIMATKLFITHPLEWLNNMSKYKVHMTGCPNYGFKRILDNLDPNTDYHWDLSNARSITNSAEPVNFDICEQFVEALQRYGLKQVVCVAYGLAEATLLVAYKGRATNEDCLSINRNCIGVGNPVEFDNTETGTRYIQLSHVEDFGLVRICDDQNHVLPDDVVGNIHVCGRMVTKGYYNDTKNTNKVLTHDRWLNTGDLGFLHDGKLVVIGRAKDIIFVNGKNYYLTDVDRLTESMEEIDGKVASCTYHNTSTDRDEVVIFVETDSSPEAFKETASNAKIFVSSRLGLEIKDVVQIDKIPLTDSGKIQRFKLVEIYNGLNRDGLEVTTRNYVAPRNETEEKLCDIWSKVLNKEKIGITDNFFDCGGDSMDAQILVTEMNDKLGFDFAGEDMFQYQTIQELLESRME